MATIPQINYGIPAMDYGPLTQSLANLGRGVGMALTMKAQQKQAAEQLPFITEQLQLATKEASAGRFGDAYSKIIGLAADPSLMQNQFISNALNLGMQGIDAASKQAWFNVQRGGGGGGGGTTTPSQGIPAMTPKEVAEEVLINRGMAPDAGMEGSLPPNFDQEKDVTEAAETIDSAAQPDMSGVLFGLSESAQSTPFRNALRSAAKNPPSQEKVQQTRREVEKYESLSDEGQSQYRNNVSTLFGSKQELDAFTSGKEGFFALNPTQKKLMGEDVAGFLLKPSVVGEGVTVGGRGGSTRFGTDAKEIASIKKIVDGAFAELSEGNIKKFIEKNGGVFNVTLNETPETMAGIRGTQRQPAKIVAYNKNMPSDTKENIQITPAQASAIKILKNFPSEIASLRIEAPDNESSIIRLAPSGPTKERASVSPVGKKLSPADQQALDWANANPDDPRSIRIKQKLGI